MPNAKMLENMSPELQGVARRAKKRPEARFFTLAHLIDVPALGRAYRKIRKDAAVGVDGVTKEDYGQNLEGNLQALHERMKSKRCRHQPILRVHIPKDDGKTRPLGISALEDKIVQRAVAGANQLWTWFSTSYVPSAGLHVTLCHELRSRALEGQLNQIVLRTSVRASEPPMRGMAAVLS